MKRNTLIYWTSTSLFSLMMLFSGTMYFISPEVKANFALIGFPEFFRVELGAAKLIGALVLVLPFFKGTLKEWAYAGFVITLISATLLHISVGDSASKIVAPLMMLAILVVSYLFWKKQQA